MPKPLWLLNLMFMVVWVAVCGASWGRGAFAGEKGGKPPARMPLPDATTLLEQVAIACQRAAMACQRAASLCYETEKVCQEAFALRLQAEVLCKRFASRLHSPTR